jgi:hypothetical protein
LRINGLHTQDKEVAVGSAQSGRAFCFLLSLLPVLVVVGR